MSVKTRDVPPKGVLCRARAEEFISRLGPLVTLDVESTGFAAENGRLVEVALLESLGGEILSTYATVLHGEIAPASLPNAVPPSTVYRMPAFKDVAEVVKNTVERAAFLVGQNIKFDVRWLRQEFDRVGMGIRFPKAIDTITLGKKAFPGLGSYNLDSLASAAGVTVQGRRHRALPDTFAEYEVFLRSVEELVGRNEIKSASDISRFAGSIPLSKKEPHTREADAVLVKRIDDFAALTARHEAVDAAIDDCEKDLAEIATHLGKKTLTGKRFFIQCGGYDVFRFLDRDDSTERTVRAILERENLWSDACEASGYRIAKLIEEGRLQGSALAKLREFGKLEFNRRVKVFPIA